MSKFLDSLQVMPTGVVKPSRLRLDITKHEQPMALDEEFIFKTSWELRVTCRKDDTPRAVNLFKNVKEELRRQIYEDFYTMLLELERHYYEDDYDGVKHSIEKLFKEVRG